MYKGFCHSILFSQPLKITKTPRSNLEYMAEYYGFDKKLIEFGQKILQASKLTLDSLRANSKNTD